MLFFENDFAPLVAQLLPAWPALRAINLDTEYEDFLASETAVRADIFAVDEDSIAELFYTSGSTGTPKGVMLSHRTVYLHAIAVAGTFNRDDNDDRTAHHSALPRQRLGAAANRNHDGSRAGDGAPIRPRRRLPSHSARARDRPCRWFPPWPRRC